MTGSLRFLLVQIVTHLLRASVLCAVLGAATTLAADPFYDTYQRGLAAFRAHDFAVARAEFLRAYDLRPEPIVLFNIAQTYRLADDHVRALVYYKRFLSESKIAESLRAEARGYVGELEAQAQARDAERRRDAEAGPTELDGTPVRVSSPPMDRVTPTAPPLPVAHAERARRRRVPTGSWIALGVAGAGIASAITLGVLGLRAEHALANDPMATRADADRVERYQLATNVSWGVAGAAAVASAVLYFVKPAYRTDRKTVVVAPSVAGGWTAAIAGRF